MTALSANSYSILSGLALQLGLEPVWSISSGDAGSDVNGWLGYALSDTVKTAQLVGMREQVRQLLGMNTTPDASIMFAYYRDLLDGIMLPFPASVAPRVWLNGNEQAFSDLAGTVPVGGGLIRRLNEPAAQGGAWISTSDPERPVRDSNAIRLELIGAAGGYEMTRPDVGGIPSNACTLVVSYVARDNALGGPVMGLLRADSLNAGVRVGGQNLWVYYGGGSNWFSSVKVQQAARNTAVIRYTPTGIDMKANIGGLISTDSIGVALGSAPIAGPWRIGLDGTAYLYGSVPQCIVVPRAVTDVERDALLAWAHGQPADAAYPDSRILIGGVGDSITRGTATSYGSVYLMLALANIRATKPLSEACNCAIGGTGVTGLLAAGSTYTTARQFYSPTRTKNILVWLIGTNDIANGNSVAYTLYGTGGGPNDGLYRAMLDAKSRGWKNVLVTIGPRSDTPANGGTMAVSQSVYNANRAAMNNDMAINWPLYAAAFADTRVPNVGIDGDSDNPALYSADRIHPIAAGHANLEPPVRAAILSLM